MLYRSMSLKMRDIDMNYENALEFYQNLFQKYSFSKMNEEKKLSKSHPAVFACDSNKCE